MKEFISVKGFKVTIGILWKKLHARVAFKL